MAENAYDTDDIVRRESALIAGPLKFACYTVRDGTRGTRTPRQFHFTQDNTIIASMPESVALYFVDFYESCTAPGSAQFSDDLSVRMFLERRAPAEGSSEPGSLIYTAFYHDMCLGVMGEQAAKLFCRMVRQTISPAEPQYAGAES